MIAKRVRVSTVRAQSTSVLCSVHHCSGLLSQVVFFFGNLYRKQSLVNHPNATCYVKLDRPLPTSAYQCLIAATIASTGIAAHPLLPHIICNAITFIAICVKQKKSEKKERKRKFISLFRSSHELSHIQ